MSKIANTRSSKEQALRDDHSYLSIATRAAEAERAGDYDHAAVLWNDARKASSSEANIEWCYIRAKHCEYAKLRLRSGRLAA